jgi:hypothetical protein
MEAPGFSFPAWTRCAHHSPTQPSIVAGKRGVRPGAGDAAARQRKRDFSRRVLLIRSSREEIERRQSDGCLSGFDAGPP